MTLALSTLKASDGIQRPQVGVPGIEIARQAVADGALAVGRPPSVFDLFGQHRRASGVAFAVRVLWRHEAAGDLVVILPMGFHAGPLLGRGGGDFLQRPVVAGTVLVGLLGGVEWGYVPPTHDEQALAAWWPGRIWPLGPAQSLLQDQGGREARIARILIWLSLVYSFSGQCR